MQLIWTDTLTQAQTPAAAAAVIQALNGGPSPFCLWLIGDLGAGKTTLVGDILHALGVPATTPVTSPTFTYMNEYRAGDQWYAHLDLYRAGPSLGLEDLGLVDARPFAGYFVEWPEQIPPNPALAPTHVLEITFAGDSAARRYKLQKAPEAC